MYCSVRGCFNDLWLDEDNDWGFCKEHYNEAKKKVNQNDTTKLYKANEKRLKELDKLLSQKGKPEYEDSGRGSLTDNG